MSIHWNPLFTRLIRQQRATLWGNWSLASGIEVGAVVKLRPHTGEFDNLGDSLPDMQIEEGRVTSSTWDMKSSGVSVDQGQTSISGTNGEVQAGLKMTWTFEEEKLLVSKFAETREPELRNLAEQLNENKDWLIDVARRNGFYSEDRGIEQGFCVVTKVIYARGGVLLASKSEDSSFEIEGSLAMFDGAASGKAGYASSKSKGTVVHRTWPTEKNTFQNEDVAIAFEVASFTGKNVEVIENWTRYLDAFTIEFDNDHWGTYIAHPVLSYDINGEHVQGITPCDGEGVWGGSKASIYGIPLEATNLQLEISYEASDHKDHFSWENPLRNWTTGKRTIDIYGVWDNNPPPHAEVREHKTSLS
ncbi:MAG: hypothetical protein RLP14_05445 [Owenweeksia sp.]